MKKRVVTANLSMMQRAAAIIESISWIENTLKKKSIQGWIHSITIYKSSLSLINAGIKKMDSYIYVVWDESKACYPDNKPNNFWLELPSTLILQGEWCIALMDVKIKTQTKNSIFLLSDVCEESYVKGNKYPVLRRLDEKTSDFMRPRFLKVTRQQIQRIRIWLLTEDWREVGITDFKCTLRLKPVT